MIEVSRRQFLLGSAGGAGALGLGAFGFDAAAAAEEVRELKIRNATETRTVCPYCAVGCSMIAYTIGGHSLNTEPVLVHIEGDPDSPINGGTLCPKGASTLQLAMNQRRAEHPMYRAPGGTEWERISWDDAMERMARWSRTLVTTTSTRRTTRATRSTARPASRLGGATISNEEGTSPPS